MPKTLLLADDSVVIQKLVGLSFANEDVRLVTADNGDDAISLATAERPDIVIADVIMPGKSGYEVCEAIKQNPAMAHIPVLLLTGTFEAFDEDRAQSAGSAGHITKPFEAQALVARVNALLASPAVSPPPPPAVEETAPPAVEIAEAQGADTGGSGAFDFFEDDVSDLSDGAPELEASDPLAAPLGLAEDEEVPLAAMDVDAGLLGSDSTVALMPEESEDAIEGDTDFEGELVELEPETELATGDELADGSATVLAEDLFDTPVDDASDWLTPPAEAAHAFASAPPEAATLHSDLETVVEEEQPDASPVEANALEDDLFEEVPDAALLADASPDDAPDASDAFDSWSEPAAAEPSPPASATDTSRPPIGSDFDISVSDLGPAAPSAAAMPERDRAAPVAERPAAGASASDAITAAMRERLNETLEKVAWEAFSELSEQVVRQVLDRVETIAWEVIPQMTESMIREEIRRMKGEDEH
jgi:CheY-like chemotaxis protein